MIFGTGQYWTADSLQWKLDAERPVPTKWDEPTFADPANDRATILKLTNKNLQQQLLRERDQ